MANRCYFFDNVKFILILLVIFGHILPINFIYPLGRGIYNFIFLFHMPLFVFISGYFTNIDNKNKFWSGILRIVKVLICFQFLHVIILLLLGSNFSTRFLYIPEYALWYLLCLLYWRILFFLVKPSVNSYRLIILSLILFFLAGFVHLGSEMAFQRAFYFFPFFCLGFYVRQKSIIGKLPKIPYNLCLIVFLFILLLSIASAVVSVPTFVYDQLLLYGDRYYATFTYPIWFNLLMRLIHIVFAIILSVCFLRIIPHRQLMFTKYGQDTLFFFLYHSVIIILLRYYVNVIPLPKSFPFCIVYFFAVLVLLFLMYKIPLFKFIINPVSRITRK